MDTTTTVPCDDLHQYATGGWYRGTPRAQREDLGHGPGQARAGLALRALVARSPSLAQTTPDLALRVVGALYGSCLKDVTGTALGVVGDTTRASYCFTTTRRYLDRALFELLMEYVWTPAARAESRQFWSHMQAVSAERFWASTALKDSTKRALLEWTAKLKLHASETGAQGNWDSTTVLWPREVVWPAGVRGPSDVPFAGPDILTTWSYRDYTTLSLSLSDFKGNLARVQAALDTVPLPAFPTGRSFGRAPSKKFILDVLLDTRVYDAGVGTGSASLPLNMLVMPVVDGKLDIGTWYGMIGPVTGHEMSHGTWRGGGSMMPLMVARAEQAPFGMEQFHGQLAFFDHPFDDAIGVLVAYDAFKRATQGRSWPVIDGFTAEQRFFLGVARGWRGGPATIGVWNNGQTRWRVLTNGTLSVMPGFARAFGCGPSDPMTGKLIWYKAPWHNVALSDDQRVDLTQDYERLLKELMQDFGVPAAKLTAEQQVALGANRRAYDVQRRTLFSAARSVATPYQIFQLLAQELGAVRLVLTSAQQAVFDKEARQWMERRVKIGFGRLEVPGVP